MCCGQNNSNSNFPTVVFVVALLVGTGMLIYHSLDITQENNRLKQAMANLQTELTARNAEAKSLNDEISACSLANAALTNEISACSLATTTLTAETNQLRSELDRMLKDYTALQTYVNGLRLPDVENLRQENNNLNVALELCNSSEAKQKMLQSSILPTDLETWTMIAVVVLIGAINLIVYAIYSHRKKASVLDRLRAEHGLPRRNRDIHVKETRSLHS
jgi:chromosome segregation ATPase